MSSELNNSGMLASFWLRIPTFFFVILTFKFHAAASGVIKQQSFFFFFFTYAEVFPPETCKQTLMCQIVTKLGEVPL